MKAKLFYGNKNHILIYDNNDDCYLQSYAKMIAVQRQDGSIELDQKYYNFSRMTAKFRNYFLNEKTKDTEKKIKSGVYKLVDLN